MSAKRKRPVSSGRVDVWASVARHIAGWGHAAPRSNASSLIRVAHPNVSLEPLIPSTRQRGRVR